VIPRTCHFVTPLGLVHISWSIFTPIGIDIVGVSQVIDKQTKALLLALLPKWIALIILVTVIWSYLR